MGNVFGALCGTLLTWGLTALGSAMVFIIPGSDKVLEQKILDASLGFAAGVMLAASYWSLLDPAIDMAVTFSGFSESLAFIPAAVGFILGAFFVFACDKFVPETSNYNFLLEGNRKEDDNSDGRTSRSRSRSPPISLRAAEDGKLRRRFGDDASSSLGPFGKETALEGLESKRRSQRLMLRRMILLVVAITVHNFPEGLAVGVGFGAVGVTKAATTSRAWNLAIGIGIQNFPEGFAVSMPLHRAGMSKYRSFLIGQLSGVVEPVAGVLGACLVSTAQALLPYSLGFAAGAMVFVVVNDLVPEAQREGGSALGSWGAIAGFVVMMSLDVAFG